MKRLSLLQNIYLIKELTKRDILSRYRGTIFGIWWSLLVPLVMLLIFTFVFGEIFQARWHGGNGNISEFAINLYSGLILFWFFNEVITKAPNLIISQPNFVTKVIFPLEILPIVTILSALFHFFINAIILFSGSFLVFGEFFFAILIVVIVIIIVSPMLLGFGWILSSLGVYFRDISTIIGVLMSMLMFLSPIFYPLEAVPQSMQWIFYFNPMTFPIEWIRMAINEGVFPPLSSIGTYAFFSFFVFVLGYKIFQSMRKGFSDVM